MTLPLDIIAALAIDPLLPADFAAICDCGGRRTGTPSEAAAQALLRTLGEKAAGTPATIVPTPYDGWELRSGSLTAREGGREIPLAARVLLRSVATPAEGVEAEILPVGRGTAEEFAEAADALRGRIALVRHEYMFAAGHIHRRLKYRWAIEAGAAGFLIAGPLATRTVAGSSGRGLEPGIPALGISPEAASRVSPTGGLARARIRIDAADVPASTDAILFDMGAGDETVVLSAHLDGHDPAESAIDNASGVAAALAVARALAPHGSQFRRRLRLAFFSAEEWALTGSRVYLAGLSEAERQAIALNVNLDSVAGAGGLTALCSGFAKVGGLVRDATDQVGVPVGLYQPLMTNSDHANFAAHGIPALRLVAGFDDPTSNVRHVLTAADTRDKVDIGDLRRATLAAAAITWAALTGTTEFR